MKIKNMNFIEAMQAMKMHKKVRRPVWSGKIMYYFATSCTRDSAEYIAYHPSEGRVSNQIFPCTQDLLAVDWEIYGEPDPDGGMYFQDALQKLREGKPIKRRSKEDIYHPAIHDTIDDRMFSVQDMEATDWVVLEY